MDRNERERKLLKEWAESDYKSSSVFREVYAESYFMERRQDEKYIWEYGFESVPEIRDLLEEQWKEDKKMNEIITVVLVATIKNKPKQKDINGDRRPGQIASEDAKALPMYIYNF